MNTPERATAPGIGAAIGYFVVLYVTGKNGWLTAEHQTEAVAFAGAIFTHILIEGRSFVSWVRELIERKFNGPEQD